MSINKSYYAIIPANVRYDKELPANAKLLYGEITALCNEKGYCWATNDYFADLYNVSKETISRWITQLTNKKYIERKIIVNENNQVIERRLYLSLDKIEETYQQKNQETIDKNINTPIDKNVKDNITLINNTINNICEDNKEQIINIKDISVNKDNIYQSFYIENKENINVLSNTDIYNQNKDNQEDTYSIDKIKGNDNIYTPPPNSANPPPKNWQVVVDYLNARTGFKYQKTDTNKRLIEPKIKQFGIETIKQIIDFKVREWKGTEWEKYLRPRTLFSSKIEDYYNQMLIEQQKIYEKKNKWHKQI